MAASSEDMQEELDKLRKSSEGQNAQGRNRRNPAFSTRLRWLFRFRYLWMLALFSLLFTTINSNSEFILTDDDQRLAAKEQAAARPASMLGDLKKITKGMFANFFLYVNIITARAADVLSCPAS